MTATFSTDCGEPLHRDQPGPGDGPAQPGGGADAEQAAEQQQQAELDQSAVPVVEVHRDLDGATAADVLGAHQILAVAERDVFLYGGQGPGGDPAGRRGDRQPDGGVADHRALGVQDLPAGAQLPVASAAAIGAEAGARAGAGAGPVGDRGAGQYR